MKTKIIILILLICLVTTACDGWTSYDAPVQQPCKNLCIAKGMSFESVTVYTKGYKCYCSEYIKK